MSGVLVVAEARRGQLLDVTAELVAVAGEIKAAAGGRLGVLVVGPDPAKFVEPLSLAGVDELVLVETSVEHFEAQTMEAAVAAAIDEWEPSLVLAGHTVDALGYASAVAAAKQLGFAADVTSLTWEDGPVARRDAYGGKLETELVFADKQCTILTMRPGMSAPATGASSPVTRTVPFAGPSVAPAVHVGFKEPPSGDVDITEAEILVSAGRGIGDRKNLEIIERLAEQLGAVMSVSRPLVDAGWASAARQVGQSGKTVKPRVYLALGISGAVQHLAGIRGAETVIAVNSDPQAPIFGVADYGVDADLFEIVEALEGRLG